MKWLFILALIIVVGGNQQRRWGNNKMDDKESIHGTNNRNTHDHDMGDMDNETMGSGECDSGLEFGGGIFNSKKFFKKITNVCVDIRFPREFYKRSKQCLKEEAKKTRLFDNMMNGRFPTKEELARFVNSSIICQLRGSGINNLEIDLTGENLLKYSMYDRWGGDKEAKENLKQEMADCFDDSHTHGYQKLHEYNRCLTKYYLKECEEKNEEPGFILLEYAKLITVEDASKCSPVRLPQDLKRVRYRCFEEAKRKMKKMPESPTHSTSTITSSKMNGSNGSDQQDMRSMKVLKHFVGEYYMKGLECLFKELEMFDTQKHTVDVNGMAKYVQKFEGWNKISKEKDQVREAIKECGEAYEEDSDENDHDRDDDHRMMSNMNMNNMNMNNTEHKEMKKLMNKQWKFDRCFIPKFTEICGFNNEVSNFFFPTMDPEFMGKVFKAFKETCGKEAEAMLTWLKNKLNE